MVDTQQQIGFGQVGLGAVLSQNMLLVPPNQRDYSWTEREVGSLLQDLSRAIGAGASEYFLGSIVTIPKRLGVLEVVDGQQRLATTAIVLASIRDALEVRPSDELIREHIENTFLTVIDPIARARVPRLRLNSTDASYFDQRVLHHDLNAPQSSRSHRLIADAAAIAAEHIAQVLKPYNEKEHGDVLNRWLEFIEHRAVVILLKVPSDANAYKMFETLNDRGLRTSQSDLVKNYLFGESGERLNEAQQKWASMKALLESITDDDDITITFLRQLLISMFGHVKKEEVYDYVQRNARGTPAAMNMLAKLESGATDYVAILTPDHEKWNEYPPSTRRAIQTVVRALRIRPIRPLMLAITRTFDTAETDRAFRMLVNLSVRFLIVGGLRSGTVEERLALAAAQVSDGKIQDTTSLLTFIESIVPGDATFEEGFRTATVSAAHLARYYLRSLEMTVKDEPDPYFIPNDDQSVINLEHVLPIEPGANWPQFTPELAAAYHRRIGNMALLRARTNANLHSAPFSEKREVYRDTPYELTAQIADLPDWTPVEIALRQSKMAAIAVRTWAVAVPTSPRASGRRRRPSAPQHGTLLPEP